MESYIKQLYLRGQLEKACKVWAALMDDSIPSFEMLFTSLLPSSSATVQTIFYGGGNHMVQVSAWLRKIGAKPVVELGAGEDVDEPPALVPAAFDLLKEDPAISYERLKKKESESTLTVPSKETKEKTPASTLTRTYPISSNL